MNPIEMMRGMRNPKQFIMQMFGNNSNPMINQLIQMAEKGNSKDLENFARNFCKEKGINFDEEFAKFTSQFKK